MEKSGSKLMQMQARFQQKQMQERELKIASLYEAQQARALERVRHSPGDARASPPAGAGAHQPGKVRQMFEERRTKGIDKSYPLQPINNTERARKPLPNGFPKVPSNRVAENGTKLSSTTIAENGNKVSSTRVVENGTKVSSTKAAEHGTKVSSTRVVENGKVSRTHAVEKRTSKASHNISSHSLKKQLIKTDNGSGDLNHNHQPDLNAVKEALLRSNGDLVPSIDALDADNNYLLENETFPEALAPVATPRSPERPPRRSPATKANPVKTGPAPAPVAPPRRAASDNTALETKKASGAMQRAANPAPIPKKYPVGVTNRRTTGSASSAASAGGTGGTGAPCAVCGRRFAPDRLSKHQEICRKAHAKKRKPFDALKHRLAGTEAEPFIGKLRKAPAPKPSKSLNGGWRQKHEEFIAAIRAAKQVQQHLAAGGKLSDLPPPPPSENPDYVSCPHCSRRFNQAAAERHIPKCATFQFNKPKAQPHAAKRR